MLTTSFEEDGYSLGVCICEKKVEEIYKL